MRSLSSFRVLLEKVRLAYRLILSYGLSDSDPPTSPRPERGRSEYSPDDLHRQAGCWQPQRSSVCWPAFLQCSLQYFPYGPFFGATYWQLGWAHLFMSAMSESPRGHSTPLKEGSQRLRQQGQCCSTLSPSLGPNSPLGITQDRSVPLATHRQKRRLGCPSLGAPTVHLRSRIMMRSHFSIFYRQKSPRGVYSHLLLS